MSWVRELQLTNFRCYEQVRLDVSSAGPVVLSGPNGAGKTNMLEAVSYLAPGRGMRGAKIGEAQRIVNTPPPPPRKRGGEFIESPPASGGVRGGVDAAWSVSARVETSYGEIRVGTGCDPHKENKRIVRINGGTAKGQSVLAEYLSCVWLTPQMDGLFIEGAAGRRRFLDRLVFAFDASHSGRVTRYENAMRQRAKLLQDGPSDPAWLEGLEQTMAESGAAIAAARVEFTGRLQRACDKCTDETFPRARLAAAGTIEELLQNAPALEVEELFRYQLKESRNRDAQTGGAASGPHKSDFTVFYVAKDMPADQCSTGEQKALLIGIILAHARLINAERGAPPILLLDEVAAHLDANRRAVLHEILLSLGGQVWLTGTDEKLFDDLRGKGAFFSIENSALQSARESRAA